MRRKLRKAERQQVYEKCAGHCAYCGCGLEYKAMQVDHMKPLHIGGADAMSNMLPACRSCNHYKGTLDVEGFRRYLAGISHRLMRDSIQFRTATSLIAIPRFPALRIAQNRMSHRLPYVLQARTSRR
jgi:hypothetical protein